tara:strand:- start:1137 stop:2285 length:1149 start_codon:yes stop_codon:yes gene_type:complete
MNILTKLKNKKIKFNLDFLNNKKILIFCLRQEKKNFLFIEKKFTNQIEYLYRDEINIFIGIITLLKICFYNDKNFLINYILTFAALKKSKIFITDHDNYPQFYRFKNYNSALKIILIQNGTRSYYGDVFWKIRNLKKNDFIVDDFIVFNQSIKEKYQKYVKSNYHILGSYRLCNILDKKIKKKKKYKNSLVYISQHRHFLDRKNKFDLPEIRIVKFLDEYCFKKKLNLYINFYNKKNSFNLIKEKNFYKKEIKYSKKNFLINNNSLESYQNVLNFDLIITCDSTMGYETLSVKKKTVFLSIRKGKHLEGSKFGWPGNFKKEGFFWSNTFSKTLFEKKLGKVINCKKSLWKKKLAKFGKKIAFQDYDFSEKVNSIITKNLKKN